MKFKQWERFPETLIALTTTRNGGVSKAPYQSLNLAYQVQDKEADVKENRRRVFEELGLRPEQVVFTHQFHSTILKKVAASDGGRGFAAFNDGIEGDALYTSEKNLALAVYHADCVPIFFYVPTRGLIGIIHAGMAGTLKSITKLVINEFCQKENVHPQDIYCYLGPCLTFSHKEISLEMRDDIASLGKEFLQGIKAVGPTLYFDTMLVNVIQLRQCGIPIENIDYAGECVYEHQEKYFSFARDQITGRMISLIYQK